MTVRVVLATRNAHKVEEMARILDAAGLAIDLVGLDSFADVPEVAETEPTFTGNALLKARAATLATGLPAIADDSGLCVDALNGMPGVLSARWSGGAGDVANLELLLAQIADVPDDRRGAQFRCSVALATPWGALRAVEGVVSGVLVREPRGADGFGYDPIFVPDGDVRTTAEMPAAQKDAISHRGRALEALVPVLIHELGELLDP